VQASESPWHHLIVLLIAILAWTCGVASLVIASRRAWSDAVWGPLVRFNGRFSRTVKAPGSSIPDESFLRWSRWEGLFLGCFCLIVAVVATASLL
jgi:hypothetical protein